LFGLVKLMSSVSLVCLLLEREIRIPATNATRECPVPVFEYWMSREIICDIK
jgi:hypothetical protein